MAQILLNNLITLLKQGVDGSLFFLDRPDEMFYCTKEDVLFLLRSSIEINWDDVVWFALINKCDYMCDIMKLAKDVDIRDLFDGMGENDACRILHYLNQTGNWESCKEYAFENNNDGMFTKWLVTEKDYESNQTELSPFIKAYIETLSILPSYVIYEMVEKTFHTNKYFKEWEILSIIYLIKKESVVYTNLPEYQDCDCDIMTESDLC